MANVWQISAEDHRSVLDVIYDRFPHRAQMRQDWGPAEYIFCVMRRTGGEIEMLEEWIAETETPAWIESAGAYLLVELKTAEDAVAFKLRWC